MAEWASFQADTDETVQLPVGGDFICYTLRPSLYCLKTARVLLKSSSLPSSLIFISLWPCRTDFLHYCYFSISLHSRLSQFCHRHLSFFNMSLSGLKVKLSLPHRQSIQLSWASLPHVTYADTDADLQTSSSSTDKTSVESQNQPAAGGGSPSLSANPGAHYTLSSTLIHFSGLHR